MSHVLIMSTYQWKTGQEMNFCFVKVHHFLWERAATGVVLLTLLKDNQRKILDGSAGRLVSPVNLRRWHSQSGETCPTRWRVSSKNATELQMPQSRRQLFPCFHAHLQSDYLVHPLRLLFGHLKAFYWVFVSEVFHQKRKLFLRWSCFFI